MESCTHAAKIFFLTGQLHLGWRPREKSLSIFKSYPSLPQPADAGNGAIVFNWGSSKRRNQGFHPWVGQ
jgi:hypothetical protein